MRIQFTIISKGKFALIICLILLMTWPVISYLSYKSACREIDLISGLIKSRILTEESDIVKEAGDRLRNEKMNSRQRAELYKKITDSTDIDFKILVIRGGLFGGLSVKIDLTVGGKVPRDGQRIRYYYVSHSIFTGFTFTTPLDVFRSKLFYNLSVWR